MGRKATPGTHRITVWPVLNDRPSATPAFTGRDVQQVSAERMYNTITYANAKGLAEVEAPAYLVVVEQLETERWVHEKARTIRPAS
jgi:hypothetical protein